MESTSIPPTRSDWAMARLSDGIITGALAPGQRLRAAALAEEWGLSQTPVREALQRLSGIGLVEATPNRGVRVAPVVQDEMGDVYSLRLLLEPFALRLSLERRDAAWRYELHRSFEALEATLAGNMSDLPAFERVHTQFHETLLARCDSTWLMRLSRMLSTHSARYRLLSLGPRGGPSEVLQEHRDLCQACLGDDIDDAVERLFHHIRRTVEVVASASATPTLIERIDAAAHLLHLATQPPFGTTASSDVSRLTL